MGPCGAELPEQLTGPEIPGFSPDGFFAAPPGALSPQPASESPPTKQSANKVRAWMPQFFSEEILVAASSPHCSAWRTGTQMPALVRYEWEGPTGKKSRFGTVRFGRPIYMIFGTYVPDLG